MATTRYAANQSPRAAEPIRRIVMDSTHTTASGLRTGIQRVVRNLGRELPGVAAARGIEFVAVACRDRGWHELPLPPQPEFRLSTGYRSVAEAVCRTLPSTHLRRALLPEVGRRGIFGASTRLQRLAGMPWIKRPPRDTFGPFRPGDLLLMPDAYWCCPEVWQAAARARAAGAQIATVVYDVIPLTRPDFMQAGADVGFRDYLRKVTSGSDVVTTISRAVRDDVAAIWAREFAAPHPSIVWHHLGMDHETPDATTPRPELRSLFAATDTAQAPYLTVSTFAPHKNHRGALDAFDELWHAGLDARFCLVGGRGWKSEGLLRAIETHPEYGRRLFKFHDLDDGEVAFCMERARGVVCPSFTEGFGLPVVEGLRYGRPTFVSDVPAQREAGGDACWYFDPQRPTELADLLRRHATNELPARGATFRPLTWKDSATQLFERCVGALGSTESAVRAA